MGMEARKRIRLTYASVDRRSFNHGRTGSRCHCTLLTIPWRNGRPTSAAPGYPQQARAIMTPWIRRRSWR